MNATTQSDRQIVLLSKSKNFGLLLIGIVFVAIGIWMISIPDADIEAQRRFNSPWLVHGLGWTAVLFFGLCSLFAVRNLFSPKPGLVLDREGLTDQSSGLAVGFIPWRDIAGFEPCVLQGQKMLVVLLENPQAYVEKGGPIRRHLYRMNLGLVGSPFAISSNALKLDFDELVALCSRYHERYRAPADLQ